MSGGNELRASGPASAALGIFSQTFYKTARRAPLASAEALPPTRESSKGLAFYPSEA